VPRAGLKYGNGPQINSARIFGQNAAYAQQPFGLGCLPRQRGKGGFHGHGVSSGAGFGRRRMARAGGDARRNCEVALMRDNHRHSKMSSDAGGDSSMAFKKERLGTPLEEWLEEEGILQEATDSAAKKVMEWRAGEGGPAGEKEAKLSELRQRLDASSVRGGSHSAEEVRAAVKARLV
jgi:hypothetical protein